MRIAIILLSFCLLALTACESAPSNTQRAKQKKDPKDYNVLENYVRKPLDQANDVSRKVEDRHKEMLID